MHKKQKALSISRLTVLLYHLFSGSSGWQDSNLRPPAPKAGAITGLRYTPKILEKAERLGLEPRQHLRADRLAICSVTTPAPLLILFMNVHSENADANVPFQMLDRNYFLNFFSYFFNVLAIQDIPPSSDRYW